MVMRLAGTVAGPCTPSLEQVECDTNDMPKRVSAWGFTRLQQSDSAQIRAMTMIQHQLIQQASRGALQAVLVRQPEKL